ncbi:MAG: glycosyltransferase family 39 protein, partial [Acidobacteria bacterium]|nr:glycosyltransferase family 39 protein [Acidobacteriota bacterium]
MPPFIGERLRDYLLLLAAGGLLFFVNLGNHSLWDVDESHNAECAREMLVADNWRVPTFNYVLRTDKPVLLYWLMIFAYQCFGVTEFAARFWSAVCGLGSLLVTYELGRAMFDRRTGLLAGLVLGSAILFCVSAHAATPDALLIFFTLLTFLLFWTGYRQQRSGWLLGIGATMGLAVLAKGPVGLLLPAAAIGLFLLWERRLRDLLSPRLLFGLMLFAAITLPWYILVGVETKWRFFWDRATGQGFFLKHNLGRFMRPLERHGGPFVYHPLAFLAGFAPWSAFLGLTVWFGTGRR